MSNLSNTIKKERFFLDVEKKSWIIDCFKENNYPLKIAEIELSNEEEVNNIDMMGLSTREMEIIDLVADGLTNQEIAVKLTISKRTVDNHVSNMLQKQVQKIE